MKWARLFELFRHECRCNIASNESHSQRFTKLKCFCTTEFQEKHKTSKYKFTSYILTPHEQPHMQLCSCGGHNHHLSFQRHRGGAPKWPAAFSFAFLMKSLDIHVHPLPWCTFSLVLCKAPFDRPCLAGDDENLEARCFSRHLSAVKSYLFWFFLDEIWWTHPFKFQNKLTNQYNLIQFHVSLHLITRSCWLFSAAFSSWWPCHSSVNQLCTKRMSPSMDPTSKKKHQGGLQSLWKGIQK